MTPYAKKLAGAVARNFELLAELKKTDPESANAVVAQIVAHLRSWDPVSLLNAQVGL